MDPEDRRRHELDFVTRYAAQLEAAGVWEYDVFKCLEDCRPAAAAGPTRPRGRLHSPHDSPPGAFWDVLFQRQIRALVDNGAFGS
jgi:hypothetical protein